MRKLLILVILSSFNLNCHQMPVNFWLSNEIITDRTIPELNVDIDQFSSHDIPRGTYRLSTKKGLSNKCVKMVIDGKISRISKDFVCFYVKNGDGSFMRIACIDINSGDHDFNIML